MTYTELLAKIKAEIDKRYAEYREKMKTDDFTYYEGMADALDLFEQFLDTLESEKPMNPDDAMKELDEKIALVKQRGTWDGVDVDKYMDEVRGREPEKPMSPEEELKKEIEKKYDQAKWGYVDGFGAVVMDKGQFIRIARHFAQWGAEHLADFRKMMGDSSEITNNLNYLVDYARRQVEELLDVIKKYDDYSDEQIEELRTHLMAMFLEGTGWQKKQMINEAVEGEVCIPNVWVEHKEGKELVVRAEISKELGFKFGDKVQVIVCKKED